MSPANPLIGLNTGLMVEEVAFAPDILLRSSIWDRCATDELWRYSQ